MTDKGVANTVNNTGKKRRGPGNPSKLKPWPKGVSGNPKGAPKRGESWAEIIKRVGEYTPAEAAEKSVELAKQFLKIGEGVTLKEAVVLRVYGATLFEPQPGLFNALMDRAEGKPNQPLDVTSAGEKLGPTVVIFKDDDENSDTAAPPPATASGGSGSETL
jgi:hypothetical protein